MPGLVVFGRRWSVGSDDLVVPALFLLILHSAWLISLVVILTQATFHLGFECSQLLRWIVVSYLVILSGCIVMEGIIAYVSTRGNIIESAPRDSMHLLLYVRLGLLFFEVVWVILSIVWMSEHYGTCPPDAAIKAILGLVICFLILVFSLLCATWCTFDIAGRKWVRMRRFQESLKDKRSPMAPRFKRSSNIRRNWRQRKAIRAYEASWDKRFHLLCCCMKRKGRNQNSFAEIAQLFTEFFRDLDVVPSDVIAGFVLLRKHQKMRMKYTVIQEGNDVYQYLSGISITPRTKFLCLRQPDVSRHFHVVIDYMKFALAAYGWPIYVVSQGGLGICTIMPRLSCFCCLPCGPPHPRHGELISDNCCHCNYAAMTKLINLGPHDIVYTTYHSDVGKTPFYIALDHGNRNVVVAIRGTLSLYDVLTDLKADCESIPVEPIREDWYGHKGIIISAVYIQTKLISENLLHKAFQSDPQKGTHAYGLALVGHSLGAGTAAILAVLLRQQYPQVQCFAYSPPGGLMSLACVEDTKDYITSVVLGKDVIPRVGLHQMELLRADLINVIKESDEPKWAIIGRKLLCCCSADDVPPSMDVAEMKAQLEKMERDVTAHPIDSDIGLSAHQPLFPPGRIIHIVRSHPKQKRHCGDHTTPVYQAIWAETSDFDEVLISPTMINDHMPDNVLDALEKTLVNVGPAKPTRILTEAERRDMLDQVTPLSSAGSAPKTLLDDIQLRTDGDHDVPQITANGGLAKISWDEAALCSVKSIPSEAEHGGGGGGLRLDIAVDWMGNAPLATPEALSASSSVVGIHRNSSVFGTQNQLRLSGEVAQRNRAHDRRSDRSPTRVVLNGNDAVEANVLNGDLSDMNSLRVEQTAPDKHIAIVTAEISAGEAVENGLIEINDATKQSCTEKGAENVQHSSDVHNDREILYDLPKHLDPKLKYIDDTNRADSPDMKPQSEEVVDSTKIRLHAFQSVKGRKSNESPSKSARNYHHPLTHTESDSFLKYLADQMTMHRSKQEDNIVKLTESSPLSEGASPKIPNETDSLLVSSGDNETEFSTSQSGGRGIHKHSHNPSV